MTPTELKGAVAHTAGDPGYETYPLALQINRINIAQETLARELRPDELLTYVDHTWAAETGVYSISDDLGISDFLVEARVTWDGYKMRKGTIDDLDEHSTGCHEPTFYYLRGGNIGLGPRPPASEKTVRLYYIKTPTAFTTTTLPTAIDLPIETHRAIELYAAYLLTNNPQLLMLYKDELVDLRWHNLATEDSCIILPPME